MTIYTYKIKGTVDLDNTDSSIKVDCTVELGEMSCAAARDMFFGDNRQYINYFYRMISCDTETRGQKRVTFINDFDNEQFLEINLIKVETVNSQYTCEYGEVTKDGVTYTVMTSPATDNYGTGGECRYYAYGASNEQLNAADDPNDIDFLFDDHVIIEWVMLNDYINNNDDNDESNACDWDKPYSIDIVN